MFYLDRGLTERGWPTVGRLLGRFYALGIVIGCLGIGNMFQANQAFVQLREATGGAEGPLEGLGWLVGTILALLVGGVLIGGIRSIAAVTGRMVPLMAGLYFVGAVTVILANVSALPQAVMNILEGAWTGEAAAGGAGARE